MFCYRCNHKNQLLFLSRDNQHIYMTIQAMLCIKNCKRYIGKKYLCTPGVSTVQHSGKWNGANTSKALTFNSSQVGIYHMHKNVSKFKISDMYFSVCLFGTCNSCLILNTYRPIPHHVRKYSNVLSQIHLYQSFIINVHYS